MQRDSVHCRFLRIRAFTLVEVTLAMGIMSFAMVTLVGLLPVGMQVFREAIDTTVKAQIVQSITSMAEQTDLCSLGSGTAVAKKVSAELTSPEARVAAGPVYYYFNDQGGQVSREEAIYTAAVVYWQPPAGGQQSNLPTGTTSSSFATLWIDIYNNKGVMTGGGPAGKPQTFSLHLADYGKRI
jgi:uncharacterized protein (TIGR02598 family)